MAKFQKGLSGNPKGRPKRGHSLSECLRAEVDGRKLAAAVCKMAYSGNPAAISLVYDRLEGRPAAQVAVSGPNGGPILVNQTLRRELIAYLDSVLSDSDLEKLDQTLDAAQLEETS